MDVDNSLVESQKQNIKESENLCFKKSLRPPPPPQLPPSLDSITNKLIKKFWTQKHIIEEGHLFAAVKAAARVRASNLSLCPFCFDSFCEGF
ncbi:hypothetical protein Bca4012_084231 [Brassica carinata]